MIQDSGIDSVWPTIEDLTEKSSQLFLKKLARNDTSWADDSGKHQGGFYIPRGIRESDYFPALVADNPDKLHIFRAPCPTLWPQTGEITLSNMSHYSNKGAETHFTGVPKSLFSGLAPASLLLGGRLREPVGEAFYWFTVLDSTSEDSEILETAFDLDSSFHYGLFEADVLRRAAEFARDEITELIERLQHAIKDGTLSALLSDYASIPPPLQIATAAREEWLQAEGRTTFDPFSIEAPGDAIMRISRDIEYRIFRRYELRHRATAVAKTLSAHKDIAKAVVLGFSELDAIFLSASQQRKTRAGRSFEHHIAAALQGGHILFQEQAVTGGRRPDFVLPDLAVLKKGKSRNFNDAIVIAAKTTLRERWKQVSSEGLHCAVYLATVDDRVPRTSISEMAAAGIILVVPESLKSSDEACYKDQSEVISFRQFFDKDVKRNRPFLFDTSG